jgi:hypothetical protein
MPDYAKLRDLVSHRDAFEFDSGARVTGYITACKPPEGPVQLVNLSRAELTDATGKVLESHATMSLVPNVLTGVRIAEGPSGRDL